MTNESNLNSAEEPESVDQHQNLTLLKIYTFYRAMLSMGLLGTFFLSTGAPLVGNAKPELFVFITTIYLSINLAALFIVLPKKIPFSTRQLFTSFLVDIAALVLIADASGGVSSGLGMLLVATIAASSIMLRAQLATLTAAMASIAMIVDVRLGSGDQVEASSFLAAGILGAILFITTFFIQTLSQRTRGAQHIALQRARDVSRLQLLNRQIIQNMRTGILVTNHSGYLQMVNEAAIELLGSSKLDNQNDIQGPQLLHPKLMDQLQAWKKSPQYHTPSFRATETGPQLLASFSALSDDIPGDILIFLEDNRLVGQRAQQMKLASLGRLTASIAHEIRNPLSAISHAAQLLIESETLDHADKRLSEIIQKHSKRVDKVIENVLKLSRRSAPNPEKIILTDWLRTFITEFKYEFGAEFHIELTDPENRYEVKIDTSQLAQVVNNLAQNGLRYSLQKTGSATLTLNVQLNPSTALPMLDIIDDGDGVAKEALDHLFEPFYTTETKGTGLGLYISRELCEANDARLDYISTEQGKSCFRISFPHSERRLSSN